MKTQYIEMKYHVFTGIYSEQVMELMQRNGFGEFSFAVDNEAIKVPFKINSIEIKEMEMENETPEQGTQTERKENATNT